jgi:hypothetical protein
MAAQLAEGKDEVDILQAQTLQEGRRAVACDPPLPVARTGGYQALQGHNYVAHLMDVVEGTHTPQLVGANKCSTHVNEELQQALLD